MQSLPDLKILKFRPDTLSYLRKQYNLDKPGQMDEVIDLLDGWIKKQDHFMVKDFPRSYLERQIILDKGSVERAKKQIEKLSTLRTLLPQFYTAFDIKKDSVVIKDVLIMAHKDRLNTISTKNMFIFTLMPELTEDHYRLFVCRTISSFNSSTLSLSYKFGACLFEYIRAHEYCNGFISVLDYRDVNIMDLIAVLNLVEMRQFVTLLTEGYQMRLKAIHLVTSSKAVELLVKIFKQIFSAKIGNRIQVHSNLESLYQHVPRELLPNDMGGYQKSLPILNDDLIDALSTKENLDYLEEISKARVDEKLRSGPNKYTDEALEIGTFRTLSVD